jgi:hypothetical protein
LKVIHSLEMVGEVIRICQLRVGMEERWIGVGEPCNVKRAAAIKLNKIRKEMNGRRYGEEIPSTY